MRGSNFGRYCGLNRGLVFAAGVVALGMLLGACSVPDSLDPAGWFSSSDTKEQASGDAKADKPARAPAPAAPDWDELREKMPDGLLADRENARHTNQPIPRQSEQLGAPPRASTEISR